MQQAVGMRGDRRHAQARSVHLLKNAFWIGTGILACEALGGWLAKSLALFGDAGHMLTDVLSIGLAWFAVSLAGRPATPQKTYGYHRASILVALLNAATLIVVAGGILAGAVLRFHRPAAVNGPLAVAVAAVGLIGNLYLGLNLGRHTESVNVRAAWLHVIGDAAASGSVVVASVIVSLTGWSWVDPLVAAGIALLIAWGACKIVAETLHVLMEGTPPGIRVGEVAAAIESVEGVRSAHHIHVWSLGDGRNAMSGHIVVGHTSLAQAQSVVARVSAMLAEQFQIDHSTLQVESTELPCPQDACDD